MADFDPYYKWLGIPPEEQPPDHYRLLGVRRFEPDPEVLEAAAERIVTYLQTVATGDYVAESQRLLNEVAAARRCLLNKERRAEYDDALRAQTADDAAPAPAAADDAGDSPAAARFDVAHRAADRSRAAAKRDGRTPLRPTGGGPPSELSPQARKRRLALQVAGGCGAAVALAAGALIWSLSDGPKKSGPAPARRPAHSAPEDASAGKPGTGDPSGTKEKAATAKPPEESDNKWSAVDAKGKVYIANGRLILDGTGAMTRDVPHAKGELKIALQVRHQTGGTVRVQWTEKDAPNFDFVRSVDVKVRGGGNWHAAWEDFRTLSALTGLRLDPPPRDSHLEIQSITLRGPRGEIVKSWDFAASAPEPRTKPAR